MKQLNKNPEVCGKGLQKLSINSANNVHWGGGLDLASSTFNATYAELTR